MLWVRLPRSESWVALDAEPIANGEFVVIEPPRALEADDPKVASVLARSVEQPPRHTAHWRHCSNRGLWSVRDVIEKEVAH